MKEPFIVTTSLDASYLVEKNIVSPRHVFSILFLLEKKSPRN
jgi:hypothetical protein